MKEVIKIFFKRSNSSDRINNSHRRINQDEILEIFKNKLHLEFNNPSLVITALKHRSYLNVTNENRVASNERLEFLGDAVLDLVVTHHLYEKFPKRTEGQLSKIKSILISKPVLAEIAANLSLGSMVLINKGEEKTGGRQRDSILADCFEAVIGAIYLDKDLATAKNFIHEKLLVKFKSIMQRELYKNYKSMLLEHAQSKMDTPPDYKIIEETGPDHDKNFRVAVYLNGKKYAEGIGKSKKTAEQKAAKQALNKLGLGKKLTD